MRTHLKKITVFIIAAVLGIALLFPSFGTVSQAAVNISAILWNGSGTEEDPYLISNAADLTALSEYVNGGRGAGRHVYFEQTADIDLSSSGKWTPIGTESLVFAGVYNGNGYTVSGMNVEGSNYLGLFGHIAEAEIRDLTVEGSVNVKDSSSYGSSGYRYVGGLVGSIGKYVSSDTGTSRTNLISGCVSDVSITSAKTGNGGIVGQVTNNTEIVNCLNKGNITLEESGNFYGSDGTGGVVGYFSADGSITGCVNTGTIINKGTGDNSIGGIMGRANTSADVTISYCYNTGDLSSAGTFLSCGAGGIVGTRTNWFDKNRSTDVYNVYIDHCYNAGKITADNKAANAGGIIGYTLAQDSYGDPVVTDENTSYVYSLNKKAAKVIYADDGSDLAASLENAGIFYDNTDEDEGIPFLLSKLGYDHFKEDVNFINGGLPLLIWQDAGEPLEGGNGRASFDITYDTKANYDIEKEISIAIDGQNVDGNAFVLSAGEHAYKISLEGYETAEGKFTVENDLSYILSVPVRLKAVKYPWIVKVVPEDAELVLKNADGKTLTPAKSEGGTYTFELYNGEYVANVSKEGYYDENVIVNVKFNQGEKEIVIQEIPETAPQEPQMSEDGFYLITKPQELYWIDWQATSVDQDSADAMAAANIRLMEDIDMTGYDWIPMNGTELSTYLHYGYYSGGCYTGIFEGNGHIISNLTIDRENRAESSYTYSRADGVGGLFGYTKGALITKLGITGSIHVSDAPVSGYGDYCHIGGIVGMAQSMTEISECFAAMDIDVDVTRNESGNLVGYYYASDTFIGGIAGSLTTGSVVLDSYSTGSLSGAETGTVNIGGIVGSTRGDYHEYNDSNELIFMQHDMVVRCYSTSDITSNPYRSGYIGGIVGMVRGAAVGEIPEIYENFALNGTLDGSGKCSANRIVGNSETFEDSGYYNYALDEMVINNASVNEDLENYASSYGLDISDADAKLKAKYDNVGWTSDVWNLDVLDQYPHLQWENLEKHVHDYEEEVFAPSCYEYGYTLYTCKICGEQVKGNFTNPGAHQFGEWIVSKEHENSHEHTCTLCGFTESRVHTWDEGTVVKEASCTEQGTILYTCTECGAEMSADVPALGHDIEGPEWVWTGLEDGSAVSAEAVFSCSRDDLTEKIPALIETIITEASCETDGNILYKATAEYAGIEYETEQQIVVPATGHNWKDPVWTWAEDMSRAEAEFVCVNDETHTERVETEDITEELTKEPSYDEAGIITYIAIVVLDGVEYKDEFDVSLTALDRQYEFERWEWTEEDGTYSAVAYFINKDDPEDEKKAEALVEVTGETDPDCETDGKIVCKAQTEFEEAVYTNEKIIVVPATGHSWDEGEWTWSEDNSSAELLLTCKTDSAHTQNITASVTKEQTKAPSEDEEGEMTYTATAVLGGETYTDIVKEVIPVGGDNPADPDNPGGDDPLNPDNPGGDEPGKQDEPQTIAVSSIKLSPESVIMPTSSAEKDSKLEIAATVAPDNATNKKLSWTSSNAAVAEVDADGNVRALSYGTAVITATDASGKVKGSCTVNVKFNDVNGSNVKGAAGYQYYYDAVYWAADNGITKGYGTKLSDGTEVADSAFFGPTRNCQRREMMIFLWRLAGCPEQNGKGQSYGDARTYFNDLKSYGTDTATNKAIAWGYKEGIVKGYSDGGFHPTASIVRKDTMIMLYRLAGKPYVSGKTGFADVDGVYKTNTDTYRAILWGSKNGVTYGYDSGAYKGKFGTMLNCLREHIVTFIYRYDKLPE